MHALELSGGLVLTAAVVSVVYPHLAGHGQGLSAWWSLTVPPVVFLTWHLGRLAGLSSYILLRPLYVLLALAWLWSPRLGHASAFLTSLALAAPLLLLRPLAIGLPTFVVVVSVFCTYLPTCARFAAPRAASILSRRQG